MKVKLIIEAVLERESGKFASRDDLIDAIGELIDDPSVISGVGPDGASVYNIVKWEVTGHAS